MRLTDPTEAPDLYQVCFVCTGNICRSPVAEAIFDRLLENAGLGNDVGVYSAGTGRWHTNDPIDRRAQESLGRHGHQKFTHSARQFDSGWFDHADLVVALDRTHQRTLQNWARGGDEQGKVRLLLSFDPEQSSLMDVPDPYYSDAKMFDQVYASIEQACRSLLRSVQKQRSEIR